MTPKPSLTKPSSKSQSQLRLWIPASLILIISLACSLPGLLNRPIEALPVNATLSVTPVPPTATPQPLPPALVESYPSPDGELPLDSVITLYFNQPMDRASVENAISVDNGLSGTLAWQDDATVVFSPSGILLPESEFTLSIASGAKSQRGLKLNQPVRVHYHSVSYLRITQSLPEADAQDVDPTSAIVVAFNRPVVSLGADINDQPVAISIEPDNPGRGEWVNTSTYIFYPDLALQGGETYRVQVNPDLSGLDGSPLEKADGWTFSTAMPRLVSIEPMEEGRGVRLDTEFSLTFNQPMNPASVEANFNLFDPGGTPVEGSSTWNEDFSEMTFVPASLLERDLVYNLVLGPQAATRGGTEIGQETSVTYTSVPPLAVVATEPLPGGLKERYSRIDLYFNGPIADQNVDDYVTVNPPVPNLYMWWNSSDFLLNINGDFEAETDYTVTISPDLPDPWGEILGEPFQLSFRTAPLPPDVFVDSGSDVLFLTRQDDTLKAQATNLSLVPLRSGSVPLTDFMAMISGTDAYELRRNYHAPDERSWQARLELVPNRSQAVDLPLSPEGENLPAGLYYMWLNPSPENSYNLPLLLVVANTHLTFKISATQAFVWAIDVTDDTPMADTPITIYDHAGNVLVSGLTDAEGVFSSDIPAQDQLYDTFYAVTGQVGRQDFGLAVSNWSQGISAWDFGLRADFSGIGLQAYLYTDRPIYRPGQTIYFRAVVRQAYNGRYRLPDMDNLPLTLYGDMGDELATFDLPLSAFGTVHGEYQLAEDAHPGIYRLSNPQAEAGIDLNFQVAEYRKPEIDLQVNFRAEQALAGQGIVADVRARYFFDAPVGNLPIKWTLSEAPSSFYIPDYQTGVEDTRWLQAYSYPEIYGPYGNLVDQGEAITDSQGQLSLEFSPDVSEQRMRYTLEVTGQDESGLSVSARASLEVNPAEFYIGLRPDLWVGQSETPMGFSVQVVDWAGAPSGLHNLRGVFNKVTFERKEAPSDDPYLGPRLVPLYTLVSQSDFQVDIEGQAQLSFTPPEPGLYQLNVSGGGTRSELLLWVGGAGQAAWPNLPNQRLRLAADRSLYQPGEVANLFVPNPFNGPALALVTIERDTVLRYQIQRIPEGGGNVSLPVGSEDAPNIYISVTLLSRTETGQPDFRQGYLNLVVEPDEFLLNVALVGEPERAGPGDQVTFTIQVTDSSGAPVQGEFSLAVIDRAVLALADPNVADIQSAFYGEQPLGVSTGLALAVYAHRQFIQPLGLGGAGGDGMESLVVRESFPDTAYWNAEIVTDQNGHAQVSLPLPDSLTTWDVTARGVTSDTRVGQAQMAIVETKELLIRPVTPRFLVVGDHVSIGAVVQNNSPGELQIQVHLQPTGIVLDSDVNAVRELALPSGQRVRLNWSGVTQDVASVSLVFSANGVDVGTGLQYQDATRSIYGDLPVQRFSTPRTFNTSGILEEGGETLELISLPRSFDPTAGQLQIELSSSLAGALVSALDSLESFPYECTEQTLSRFLPNLETWKAMQALGLDTPDLQSRLERTLQEGLQRLQAQQNQDGGWGWWQDSQSDSYITAYVLFGLAQARRAGVAVDETMFSQAVDYLYNTLTTPQMTSVSWQLNRLALTHFALAESGAGDLAGASALFMVRDQLSPWAQAFLALTLERLSPGSDQARTLASDLKSSAIRTATGAHWEQSSPGAQNMSTPVSTTAIVVYALAQRDPSDPLLMEAVRYLMSHRQAQGGWSTTYNSAWVVLGLVKYMESSGDLSADFNYSASLNGTPLLSGQADFASTPVSSNIPIAKLYADHPNALVIRREPGPGRLYYSTALDIYRPVEEVGPLSRGISVQRSYRIAGRECEEGTCQPIDQARVGELIEVRLTLTLQESVYYLLVEDYFPAGTEVLDTSLKTSQQVQPDTEESGEDEQPYDYRDPLAEGWGWWFFSTPSIYDERIAWAADYLPAGTYELTYTLAPFLPGEYRVLPGRAWQFYFPEVQGNSSGQIFTVLP